jgi:hypothetical protein
MKVIEKQSNLQGHQSFTSQKENQSIMSLIVHLLDHETIDEWLEKALHILLYGIACPFTIYLLFQFLYL